MNEALPEEVIVLQELCYKDNELSTYVGIIRKQVVEIRLKIERLPYGSVIITKPTEKVDHYLLNQEPLFVKNDFGYTDWSPILGDHQMCECDALTTGCFTFMDDDYDFPCAFNNSLGIISDRNRTFLNECGIAKIKCRAVAVKTEGRWEMKIEKIISCEKINQQKMTTSEDNKHVGIVTRVETDERRDLRLVSSRDFPSDVRIFKKGHHNCEAEDSDSEFAQKIGDKLLGSCVNFGVVACSANCPSSSVNVNRMGVHVDRSLITPSENILSVQVHGQFVEIRTKVEWLGFQDHNGSPLLWSHDLEFIVDEEKMFQDKDIDKIYLVNAVRYHRQNVFAKWRLTRKNAIVKVIEMRRGRNTRSVNLGSLEGMGQLRTCPPTPTFSDDFTGMYRERAYTLGNPSLNRDNIFVSSSRKEEEVLTEEDPGDNEPQWEHLIQIDKIVED